MNISSGSRNSLPIWYLPTKTIPPGFAPPSAAEDAYTGTVPEPVTTRPSFRAPSFPVHATPAPVYTAPPPDYTAPSPEPTFKPVPTPEPAPPVDRSAILRSLESIKSTAGDAGYQAGQMSDSLGSAQSTQPKADADSAAWTLRNAESDTDTTDSSSYGRDAKAKLDAISSTLGNLATGSPHVGSLSNAISSIRSQLGSIDRSKLSDTSRLDSISSSLSLLENDLSASQNSVSNVQASSANARYSLTQGDYYVSQVSADQEGVNVSSAASSGRGYVETLSGQLESVRSNAAAGGGSLSSMKDGFGDLADDADALIWQIRA